MEVGTFLASKDERGVYSRLLPLQGMGAETLLAPKKKVGCMISYYLYGAWAKRHFWHLKIGYSVRTCEILG